MICTEPVQALYMNRMEQIHLVVKIETNNNTGPLDASDSSIVGTPFIAKVCFSVLIY